MTQAVWFFFFAVASHRVILDERNHYYHRLTFLLPVPVKPLQ